MTELEHDSKLAREVFKVLQDLGWSKKSYHRWLRAYVRELAEAVDVKLVFPKMRTKTRDWPLVSFKVPRQLLNDVDSIALDLGITRSEVIRLALFIFVKTYEEVMKREGGELQDRGGVAEATGGVREKEGLDQE